MISRKGTWPATKPDLPLDASVHYAKYAGVGGGLCEDICDLHFGALWDGPRSGYREDGPLVTHVAEAGFRFTFRLDHVTCPKCNNILNERRCVARHRGPWKRADMNINTERVNQLRDLQGVPRFALGAPIRDSYGNVGRIDVVYADLQAAFDSYAIPKDWYDIQEKTPRTGPGGRWYSVVTPDGAVLAGEDDLEPA